MSFTLPLGVLGFYSARGKPQWCVREVFSSLHDESPRSHPVVCPASGVHARAVQQAWLRQRAGDGISMGAVHFALGTTLGAAVGARRLRRLWMGCQQEGPEQPEPGGYFTGVPTSARMLTELTEEELLEFELAEEDLCMEEEEEEEWRKYDEEVKKFQELMDTGDVTTDQVAQLPNLQGFTGSNGYSSLSLPGGDTTMGRQMDEDLDALGALEAELREMLEETGGTMGSNTAVVPAQKSPLTMWAPGTELATQGSLAALPPEYSARLTDDQSGVVVTENLGANTVVLLSRGPGQPELLPVLSETFRVQKVRILRGWLDVHDGAEINAFEVCDITSGEPLSADRISNLERALVTAMRGPAAREVLLELDERFPRLDAFYGLPADGSWPPPLPAARGALLDGPFKVSDGRDLGRALVLRGELITDMSVVEALKECRSSLWKVAPKYYGEWECVLVHGQNSDKLLLVLPSKDIEQYLAAPFDEWIVLLLCTWVTVIYAQSAAPAALTVVPPVSVLVFGVIGWAEVARRLVARKHNVDLSLPFLLPSYAFGILGTATRAKSLIPNAIVSFDMASAALTASFFTSLVLIAVGYTLDPSKDSCAWINISFMPYMIKSLLQMQSDGYWDVCLEPPPGGGFLPASSISIAGCFGLLATALNALPLSRLDGASLAAAAPWVRAADTILPWAALLLLFSTLFGPDADGLFPVFAIFTFGVRPYLTQEPVYQDNISQPQDLLRRSIAFVLLLTSSTVLLPRWAFDGFYGDIFSSVKFF